MAQSRRSSHSLDRLRKLISRRSAAHFDNSPEQLELAPFLLFMFRTLKEIPRMTYRTCLPYLVVSAILSLAVPAFSQDVAECASHVDCAAGYTCEKGAHTNGCSPDADSCDTEVYEDEFGTCHKQPPTCEADEDCGEYLSCQSSGSGDCWASSDGSSGCSEPDPDAPQYCAPAFVSCEVDDDCPRSFECSRRETCATVDCAEGEACDPPECESSGGVCVPQYIECDADADCPSAWSCVNRIEYTCSGGGSEPDSGGTDSSSESDSSDGFVAPDEADADGDAAAPAEQPPEQVCTEVEREGSCEPNAWEDSYFGGGDATDGSAESPRPVAGGEGADDLAEGGPSGARSDADSSNDAAGCSVTAGRTALPGPLGLLLLMTAPFVLLLRRRPGDSA